MFKNRKMVVTLDKVDKNKNPEDTTDTWTFEQKASFVMEKLESSGVKVFFGIGGLIVLDTLRKIAVAKVSQGH